MIEKCWIRTALKSVIQIARISSVISKLSRKEMKTASQQRSCNCRTCENCTLDGNCQGKWIVYSARINLKLIEQAIELPWKKLYYMHNRSFISPERNLIRPCWFLQDVPKLMPRKFLDLITNNKCDKIWKLYSIWKFSVFVLFQTK